MVARRRKESSYDENETWEQIKQMSVEPSVLLVLVYCHRQQKAERLRVTTYQPTCSGHVQ